MSSLDDQAAQLLADAGLTAPSEPPAQSVAVQQSDDRNTAIVADISDGALTFTAIAAKHGVAVSTVSRLAAKVESLTEGARKYLMARNFRMVDAWMTAAETAARKGDHRPAKDALLHTGAIEPLADTNGQRGPQVAIVIGTPDAPIRVSHRDTET